MNNIVVNCITELYDNTRLCQPQDLVNWKPSDLHCIKCTTDIGGVVTDHMFIANDVSLKPLKYDLDNLPIDFSKLRMVGIEIEYFELNGLMSECKIVTGDKIQEVPLNVQLVDFSNIEYNNLNCPSQFNNKSQIKRAYFTVESNSFDMITVRFEQQNINHIISIGRLRVYVTCMQNCLNCSTHDKCLECMPGFNLISIDDNFIVCEQIGQCSVQNCFSCPTLFVNKCYKCKLGFQLNGDICELIDPCYNFDYYDTFYNECAYYSNLFYFYSYQLQKYELTSSFNSNDYKCPKDTIIIIQNYYQEGQYSCGCLVDHCQRCTSASKCKHCEDGYNLNGDNCEIKCSAFEYYIPVLNQCAQCPGDFNSCDSDMCCKYCSTNNLKGYKYSIADNKCIQFECPPNQKYDSSLRVCICNISNCQVCYSDNKCDQCKQGYQYDKVTQTCKIKLCLPSEYYSKDDDECIVCPTHCTECNKTQCYQCETYYEVDQSNINKCKRICKLNCKTCDDSQICSECTEQNYYINPLDQTQCLKCGQFCSKCNENECIQCEQRSYKDSINPKNCIKCSQYCLDCTETDCIQCVDSSYKSDTNLQNCILCDQTCKTCNKNECLECKSSLYKSNLNPQTCKMCSDTCGCKAGTAECEFCKDGYRAQGLNFPDECEKIPCSANCELCRQTECIVCKPGFFIDDDNKTECKQCDIFCNNCDISRKLCLSCIAGYSPEKDKCVKCHSSCETCSSTECLKCFKNGNIYQFPSYQDKRVCISCSENCMACDHTTLKCLFCNIDSVEIPNSDKCMRRECHNTCSRCSQDQCIECKYQNQRPFILDKQQCRECDQNCMSCQIQYGGCELCMSGFYLDESTYSCVKCDSLCKRCNQNQCLECIFDSLTVDDNNPKTCVSCAATFNQCKKCSANSCIECENGQYDSVQKKCLCHPTCEMCSGQNCIFCKEISFQVDIQNRYQCIPCQPSCKLCLNNECHACKDIDQFVDHNNKSVCRSCSDSNCLRCDNLQPEKCSKCKDGYTLNAVTNKCDTFVCRATNCISCYPYDEQQCQICQNRYTLDTVNNICLEINQNNKNTFSIKQSVSSEGYIITLQFQKPIQTKDLQSNLNKINAQKYFKIELSDTQPNQYIYSINSVNQNEIQLQLVPQVNVKSQQITIKIIDQQLLSDNLLVDDPINSSLETFVKIPQNQINASKQVSSIGNTVSMVTVSSFVPIAIFSNFYLLTNTIDHTSFFYFLMFTNIRYPQNVLQFYSMFQNFQFPFIPNVFLNFIDSDYEQQTPQVFMENNNDAFFLKNSGQAITICCGVIALFLLVRTISYLPIKGVQPYLKKTFCNYWIMSAFLDLLFTEYLYLLYGSLLQFYCFDGSERGYIILNYVLFCVITFILFVSPFLLFNAMYNQPVEGISLKFKSRFQTIISGLNIPEEPQSNQTKAANCKDQQNEIGEINSNSNNKLNEEQTKIQNINLETQQGNRSQNNRKSEISKQGQSPIQLIVVPSQNSSQISHPIPPHFNNTNNSHNIQITNNEMQGNHNVSAYNHRKNFKKRNELTQVEQHQHSQHFNSHHMSSFWNNNSTDVLKPQATKEDTSQILTFSQQYSRYYYPILYLRKLLFLIIICFLYFDPLVQLAVISFLNVLVIWFLIFVQPFSSKYENLKIALWEMLLIGVQICSAFLISDNQSQDEEERFNIGWIIIGLTSIIIIVDTTILLLSLIKPVFSRAIKYIKKALKKQKEYLSKLKESKSKVYQSNENDNKSLQSNPQIHTQNTQKQKNDLNHLIISPSHRIGTQGLINTETNELLQLQNQQAGHGQPLTKSHKRITKSMFVIQTIEDEIEGAVENDLDVDEHNSNRNEVGLKKYQSCHDIIINGIQKEAPSKEPRNNNGVLSSELIETNSDQSNYIQGFPQKSNNNNYNNNNNYYERKLIPQFRTNSLFDIKQNTQEIHSQHQISFEDQLPKNEISQKRTLFQSDQQKRAGLGIFSSEFIMDD